MGLWVAEARLLVHFTGLGVLVVFFTGALLVVAQLLVQPFLRVDLKFAGVEVDRVPCVTAFRRSNIASVMPLETEVSGKFSFNSVDPVALLGDIGVKIRRLLVALLEEA